MGADLRFAGWTFDRLLDLTRTPGTEVSDRSIDLAVSRLRGEGCLFDAPVEAR